MILFFIHLAIAVLLGYLLVEYAVKSGKKDLIIPTAGIVTLFLLHCITFKASCLECSLSDPRCIGELLLFWFFAGWAIIKAR